MSGQVQAYGDRGDFAFLPYDPRSPDAFQLVASAIHAEAGGLTVEHVGSTAVPGCGGKGFIDVLVLASRENQILGATRMIQRIGFVEHHYGQGYPGARGAVRYDGTQFRVHIQILPKSCAKAREMLDFRELLKNDPELLTQYLARKRSLITAGINRNPAYTNGKSGLIEDALRRFHLCSGDSQTPSTELWRSGDAILLRTVVENLRVGSVLPTTVVRDSDDLVALYLAPGTTFKRRMGKRGGPGGRVLVEDTGRHEDWTWSENRRLLLWRPHESHAVSLFWRDADDTFLGWYIDVLEPLRRTPLGFDTRDLILDVVIDPDRTWHWKDEDELLWREEHGYIAPPGAKAIRTEGKRSVALLQAHDPLFADHWTLWRPDRAWPIPEIAGGWSVVLHS